MSSPEDQVVIDAKPSRRRLVKTGLKIGGVVLALAAVYGVVEGVTTASNNQHQSDLRSDAETLARDDGYDRFVHDYATDASAQTTTHIGQGCLAGTGYDPYLKNRDAGGVVSADASGEIIVTAFGNAKTALVFENPNGNTTHNLTPANMETYQTLVANGCSPGTAYGDLN